MPLIEVGEVSLAYEIAGAPDQPTVVLVNGLGNQLVWWPMGFVHAIAIAGYRVVRFDNRDVGLSTHFEGKPKLSGLRHAVASGEEVSVPYTIADMAADLRGLVDHLDRRPVHLVGLSMGGAIVQRFAIAHPYRMRSMTLVMSSTGNPSVGRWNARGGRALFHAPPLDRRGAIEATVDAWELLAPPGTFDRERARIYAAWQVDRAFDPSGPGRQLVAVWADSDRTPELTSVEVPTLVIHGDEDPLVSLDGGRALFAALPNARSIEIRGMGHELPERCWPAVLGPLLQHLADSPS